MLDSPVFYRIQPLSRITLSSSLPGCVTSIMGLSKGKTIPAHSANLPSSPYGKRARNKSVSEFEADLVSSIITSSAFICSFESRNIQFFHSFAFTSPSSSYPCWFDSCIDCKILGAIFKPLVTAFAKSSLFVVVMHSLFCFSSPIVLCVRPRFFPCRFFCCPGHEPGKQGCYLQVALSSAE